MRTNYRGPVTIVADGEEIGTGTADLSYRAPRPTARNQMGRWRGLLIAPEVNLFDVTQVTLRLEDGRECDANVAHQNLARPASAVTLSAASDWPYHEG